MKTTERGFAYKEFKDINGEICTIQKSSLATEDAIWLGAKELKVQQLIPGKSWQPVEFTGTVVGNERMHLSRKQVKKLLPLLQKFVETGDIS